MSGRHDEGAKIVTTVVDPTSTSGIPGWPTILDDWKLRTAAKAVRPHRSRPPSQTTGVSGTVVVQARQEVDETVVLETAADTEWVLGVVGWVDLAADVPETIDEILDRPGGRRLVGIRHLAHDELTPSGCYVTT